MNTVVCIKQVPDTETRIRIAAEGPAIEETDVNFVVSPYDEFAMEEALQLKEKAGAGTVTALCLGRERATSALRTCLALGADAAVHVVDERADQFGPGLTAKVLCAAVGKLEAVQLVFAGTKGVGGDNGQVGIRLAQLLDWSHCSTVVKLAVDAGAGTFEAHREVEGAREVVEGPLPAVFTAQKDLNQPRYASLKGIMAAKKKPITTWTLADLGFDAAAVEQASRRAWKALELPPPRPEGRIIDGSDPAAAARELVQALHETEKLI